MMTQERRDELMKEQKKYLINRIERLEELIDSYRNREENQNKEIENLKERHEIEIQALKEKAYEDFLAGKKEHLERFVKEYLLENLVVDVNVSGCFLSGQVTVHGETGQSSSDQMIRQDSYGTII